MSWEIDYKKKLRTPDEALRCVQSGMRVYIRVARSRRLWSMRSSSVPRTCRMSRLFT